MYLMYVDESGDTGICNSPTRYFVLTGLILHELCWQDCLDNLITFRRRMRDTYGLKLREEIHAFELISKPGSLRRITKYNRLLILRSFARELAGMSDLNVINIVVDKSKKQSTYDVFHNAWRALIQRFENTIAHSNFTGPANPDDRGIILPDRTDDKKLVRMIRQLRRHNPIPNQNQPGYRNLPLRSLVEDPCFRDSGHSYFIQACDMIAYLLKQQLEPNSYMRKKGRYRYFSLISTILCKSASRNDPDGIVRL